MIREIEKLEIRTASLIIDVYRPKAYMDKRKTIICYHGWSSSIEAYDLFGQIFASHGYQVILPEIHGHGQKDAFEDYSDIGPSLGVLVQSLAEFEDVKRIALERLNADPKSLILMGHSLGSMIASMAYSRSPDFRHLVIYNGMSDLMAFVERIGLDREEIGRVYGEDFYDILVSLDPKNNYSSWDQRTVDIYIGREDRIIDPETMPKFISYLEGCGLDTSGIKCFTYPASHTLTYDMIRDSLRRIVEVFGVDEPHSCNKKGQRI